MMKSSLDHLPEKKQRELARILQILLEELEDMLKEGSAEFKKMGRVLKAVLFGSYARGDWIDEPHTMKGYRSDYDLLLIVNNKKLTDFSTYWYKAAERLLHDRGVSTPVSFIVHSRREINTALKQGQYFFSDIRRQGIVIYELDEEPLAEPKPMSAAEEYAVAKTHFEKRFPAARRSLETAAYQLSRARDNKEWNKDAAFATHQAIEQSYSSLLLTLTNYGPPSHNLNFLRSLAEGRDLRLAEAWPRDQQRFRAWFNTVNEAYVKARYSEHYEISSDALEWLSDRAAVLQALVALICQERLSDLAEKAGMA